MERGYRIRYSCKSALSSLNVPRTIKGVLKGLYTSKQLVVHQETTPAFQPLLALRGEDWTSTPKIELHSLYESGLFTLLAAQCLPSVDAASVPGRPRRSRKKTKPKHAREDEGELDEEPDAGVGPAEPDPEPETPQVSSTAPCDFDPARRAYRGRPRRFWRGSSMYRRRASSSRSSGMTIAPPGSHKRTSKEPRCSRRFRRSQCVDSVECVDVPFDLRSVTPN